MNQSDLLAPNPREIKRVQAIKDDKNLIKSVENKIESNKAISGEYVEITLSSKGKLLNTPKSLHFRDYTLQDLIDLNSDIRSENYLESKIKVLNRMVYEDYDCGNLTEEELIEILLSIHKRWHGKFINEIPYYLDENISDLEEKESKRNIAMASVELSTINVIPIANEFKEPFEIGYEDNQWLFILPRVNNIVFAKNYVEEKYKELESKYDNIKALLLENKTIKNPLDRYTIPEKERKEYEELINQKITDTIRITTALTLYGKKENGKIIQFTNEQKVLESNNVKPKVWAKFSEIKNKYLFGVDSNVTFFSKELEGKVTRRLRFQFMDFVPAMEYEDDSEIRVSFDVLSENESK